MGREVPVREEAREGAVPIKAVPLESRGGSGLREESKPRGSE